MSERSQEKELFRQLLSAYCDLGASAQLSHESGRLDRFFEFLDQRNTVFMQLSEYDNKLRRSGLDMGEDVTCRETWEKGRLNHDYIEQAIMEMRNAS